MKKILLILLPIIIIFGGVLGGGYYIYDNIINTNAIYEGVKIDSYEVGTKDKAQALVYLKEQKEKDDIIISLHLFHNDKTYDIKLADLGYTYDYETAIDSAYNIGRDGSLFERYKRIMEVKKNGELIALDPLYDRDKILLVVENIANDIDQEGIDSTFNFNNGKMIVTDHKDGRTLNKELLAKLIEDNIYEPEDIEMPVDVVKPKFTKDFFGRINGIIGEYSTSFKGSSAGRIHNIKLSAESLNNKLIMPGEEISYNSTTGPRQSKFGYKEAPVIQNGELTPGIGGGVCQTSTTLYNALLLSDLTITERHPHSIAASYVPRGQDGAVATGYLDLKFKNDYDFPIYLNSKVVGDRVYFYIYGDTKSKDYTIKIEPELIATIPYNTKEIFDATALPGSRQLVQEGRTGYKVRTYKSIIKNGVVISREQISYDYYRERDYIYKVGPAAPVFNESQPEPVEEETVEEILP